MANDTSYLNYISDDRQLEIVEFMKENFSDLTDTMPNDSSIYQLAKDSFPQYKFSPWKEEHYKNYPANPDNVDTSVDTSNALLKTPEKVWSYWNNIPKEKVEKALGEYLEKQPKSEIKKGWTDNPLENPELQKFIPFSSEWHQSLSEAAFGDVIMDFLPENMQEDLKMKINNTTSGYNYQIRTGEDKYEVDPNNDYDVGFISQVGLNLLAWGPYDIAFLWGGSKMGQTTLSGVKKIPGFDKVSSWAAKRTYDYMNKILPKSKNADKVRKFLAKYFDANKAAEQIFTMGQSFGFTHAAWGITESMANQRMSRGKYEGGDGTISPWDTTIDGGISYGEGVAMGTAIGFTNNVFDSFYKYTKPRWQRGQRDAKTVVGKVLSNPVSKYGSHGITFASLPLIWDKERRRQYVDEDGNILYNKYIADVATGSLFSLSMVGLSRASGISGNAEEFVTPRWYKEFKTLELTKTDRTMLRQKYIESQQAAVGKAKKDVSFDEWIKTLDGATISALMKGKKGIEVSLAQKLKASIGIRPTMPWAKRNSKIYAESVPDDLNFSKALLNIRNNTKQNIKYEKKKLTNESLQTDESKLIKESLQNVQKELKGVVPYEFFEKNINEISTSIDMGDGVKAIYEIAKKSIDIIRKISVKNQQGEVIGVDNSKLTDDDAFYLRAYTPMVIPAYQEYISEYIDTQEGKDAYIKRFEVEENQGKKLTKKQADLLINTAKSEVKQLDVIREYMNRQSTEGLTSSEQTPVADGNKTPDLSPIYKEVILLDEKGLPQTGVVLSLDKSEADKFIKAGRAITVPKTKEQNISVQEVKSKSVGNNLGVSEIKSYIDEKIDPLVKSIPVRDNVKPKINAKKFEIIKQKLVAKTDEDGNTIDVKNNILLNKIRNYKSPKGRQLISDSYIENITDAIDIWAMEKIPNKGLFKWINYANKLLKYSGKNKFSEITTNDITNYFDRRISEKKALFQKRGKQGNFEIDDGERSGLKKMFENLDAIGAVASSPYIPSVFQEYGTRYRRLARALKKTNELTDRFFKSFKDIEKDIALISKGIMPKMPSFAKFTKKFIKEDKGRLALAFELFKSFPIRDQEINAIRGITIRQYNENMNIPKGSPGYGQWFIDLTLGRGLGGGAKEKGVMRPIPITEEMARKLITIHGKLNIGINELTFPKIGGMLYSKAVTNLLKKALNNPRMQAKEIKSQLKDIAESYAGLTDDAPLTIPTVGGPREIMVKENVIYNVVAGHAKADDKSIEKTYTEPRSYGIFFESANSVIEKVQKAVKTFTEPIPSVEAVLVKKEKLPPLVEGIKKVEKGIKETGGGLAIKDISEKSDKEIVNEVKSTSKISTDEEFKKKYYLAANNEFKRQTKNWTEDNKEKLIEDYARETYVIENWDNMTIRNKDNEVQINPDASMDDLVRLSEQLLAGKDNIVSNRIKTFKVLTNVRVGDEYAERANIPKEERVDIIKREFGKSKFTDLSIKESSTYRRIMHANALVIKDDFHYATKLLDEEHFINIVKKLPKTLSSKIKTGFAGQDREISILLEKHGLKGMVKLYQDKVNHLSHEVHVQGFLKTFEEKAARILAGPGIRFRSVRQSKAKVTVGKRKLKKMEDDLFWLDEDMWKGYTEFVKRFPEYKDITKAYNKSKKFVDKVYKKQGVLRIDTPESQVAKAWHEMTEKVKQSYIDGFKLNMTEQQYNSMIKKNPIRWITHTFYVNRSITKEFSDALGLDLHALEEIVKLNQQQIAYDNAFKKHGKTPTIEQVDAEMTSAKLEAYNSVRLARKFNPARATARFFLTRQFDSPPFAVVNGRPIQVWDSRYSTIATRFIASAGKLSATVRHMPYMLDMRGLPGEYSKVPVVLSKLSLLKGRNADIGKYVQQMIYATVGIQTSDMGNELKILRKAMAQGNHILSRGQLAWYFSAIKNAGIGISMNYTLWAKYDRQFLEQQKELAVNLFRALSFDAREAAKGRGIIQLALQSLDTGWAKNKGFGGFAGSLWEKQFKLGKFGSSEMVTRLHAAFMAIAEVPKLVDILRAGPKDPLYDFVMNKLRTIYELGDEQIWLMKQYGLGNIEAKNYKIKTYGLDAKRFELVKTDGVQLFNGEITNDPYKISNEITKLNDLHQKIITMAHINTQGATAPIMQPYFLQTPFAKEGMLYKQMAIAWNFNFNKIMRLHKKEKSWWRFFTGMGGQTLFQGLGMFISGSVLMALRALLSGAPSPNELEDRHWKKILNAWIVADIGGYFNPVLKMANGEMPTRDDVVGMVAPETALLALSSVWEVIKYMVEELGFKPEGSNEWARFLQVQRRQGQSFEELAGNMSAMYRNVRLAHTNYENPYYKRQKRIKEFEREYLKTTNRGRTQVVTGGEVGSWNEVFIKNFEESDSYKDIANSLIDKYIAHKQYYMKQGKSEEWAQEHALAECEAILKRRDPLDLGMTSNGDILGLSGNDYFIFWLMKQGDEQGEIWKYVDEFDSTRTLYNERVDSVASNFKYIARNESNIKNSGDLKYLLKLKPAQWDDIGVFVDKDSLYFDFSDSSKAKILKRYGRNLKNIPLK